ncbi:MAG: hypothetical protein PHX30_02580 [Candidatus Pacebacteria bacterium]|nr:hypothetical protein [Candidatus Paceibacterota bacterium]
MDQNDKVPEETASGHGAFERFKTKIRELSERQDSVFKNIMQRINERKIVEVRQKLDGVQDDDKQ